MTRRGVALCYRSIICPDGVYVRVPPSRCFLRPLTTSIHPVTTPARHLTTTTRHLTTQTYPLSSPAHPPPTPRQKDKEWGQFEKDTDENFFEPGAKDRYKRGRSGMAQAGAGRWRRDGSRQMPEDEFELRRDEAYRHFQKKLGKLRTDVMTWPNLISMARLSSIAVISPLIYHEQLSPALALFVVAGVSDLVDGWIVSRYPSQGSVLGTALDPLADKVLVTGTALSLVVAGYMPLTLFFIYLFRDVVLLTGATYVRHMTLSEPRTFQKFFNLEYKPIRWKPSRLSKINTVQQVATITACLACPVLGFVDSYYLKHLFIFSGGYTFITLLFSAFNPRLFEVLDEGGKEKQT